MGEDEVLWAGRPQRPLYWRYKLFGHLLVVSFVVAVSMFLSSKGYDLSSFYNILGLFCDSFGFASYVFISLIFMPFVVALSDVLVVFEWLDIKNTSYILTEHDVVIKKDFLLIGKGRSRLPSLKT